MNAARRRQPVWGLLNEQSTNVLEAVICTPRPGPAACAHQNLIKKKTISVNFDLKHVHPDELSGLVLDIEGTETIRERVAA